MIKIAWIPSVSLWESATTFTILTLIFVKAVVAVVVWRGVVRLWWGRGGGGRRVRSRGETVLGASPRVGRRLEIDQRRRSLLSKLSRFVEVSNSISFEHSQKYHLALKWILLKITFEGFILRQTSTSRKSGIYLDLKRNELEGNDSGSVRSKNGKVHLMN